MKKRKGLMIFAVLVVFVFWGSRYSDRTKPKIAQNASMADQEYPVVRNLDKPKYGDSAIRLKYEIDFGTPSGGENAELASIGCFAIDDEESVYIYDQRYEEIKVFDKYGRWKRSLGRVGQGPGEYQIVDKIQFSKNNEIILHDSIKMALIYFDKQGKYLRESRVPLGPLYSFPSVDYGGQIYAIQIKNSGSVFQLVVKRPSIDIPEVLAFYESNEGMTYPRVGVRYACLANDYVIWTSPPKYEMNIVDHQGKIVKKIINKYEQNKIDDAFKSKILSKVPPQFRDQTRFQEYLPPIDIICPDDDGGLYVKTFKWEKNGKNCFVDVYDKNGVYLTRIAVKMPDELSLNQEGKIAIRKNKIYVKDVSSEGFPILKRYAIMKTYSDGLDGPMSRD